MIATTPPSIARIVVNTTLLWVATSLASVALWPIYRDSQLIVLISVALAVGTLITIVGARLRWTGVVVAGASCVAFLAIGVPLAVPSKAILWFLPSLGGLADLVAGVALGWKQLVTITLPVGTYQALLVPALVMVFTTTVVAGSVALRAARSEIAVIGPVALYVAATALGPQQSSQSVLIPLSLMAVTLFWVAWIRWNRRHAALPGTSSPPASSPVRSMQPASTGASAALDFRAAGRSTALGAVLIVALACGAAVVAEAALPPGTDRAVVRTAFAQPFEPRDYVSPLSVFRRYFQPATANSVLFTVGGLPAGARIRIATMDTYDGVVYSVGGSEGSPDRSSSGSFTRVPSSYDQTGVAGTPVALTVTIGSYSDVWVPTVGQLENITFTGNRAVTLRQDFFYNNVSGSAAVPVGLSAGDGYNVTAVIPTQPSLAQLSTLTPGAAVVPKPAVLPDDLAGKLDEYVGSTQGAGPRLVAMLAGLNSDGYISHGVSPTDAPSRSGHSVDRIGELLSAPQMIGDAEQYAVAAALMARELGFPSRVVFGFAPTTAQVHGADASAWIEVDTAQFGWVTIDPTPPPRPIPAVAPQETQQVARPQSIVPPPAVESDTADRPPAHESEQQRPLNLDPVLQVVLAVVRVVGWIAVAVAIVLSPFLVVIAAKLRRRRLRRRASIVMDRISGGWQEFEDSVRDHRFSPTPAATRSEVAALVGHGQATVLAAVTDRAIFAPGEPEPAEADSVWRAVDELTAALDAPLTRLQRVRAMVSLRSLGGVRGGVRAARRETRPGRSS